MRSLHQSKLSIFVIEVSYCNPPIPRYNFPMLSLSDFLIVVAVGTLAFKWRSIPELGSTLGKSIGEFKKGLEGDVKDVSESQPPETITSKRKDS